MRKFLFALMLIWASTQMIQAATSFTVDGYYYEVLSEDEKTVEFGTNKYYNESKTTVTVPKNVEYNGVIYTVTAIGKYAFAGHSSSTTSKLTTVKLPSTIRVIGNHAFEYCKKLRDVQLPNNLETIGNSAFAYAFKDYGCSLILPESVKTIGQGAFNTSGLKKLVIGKNVEKFTESHIGAADTVVYNAIHPSYEGSGGLTARECLIIGEEVSYLPTCFALASGYNADLIIPDNIEVIEPVTFTCSSPGCEIKHLSFGSKLKMISPDAFRGGTTYGFKVSAITCKANIPPVVYDKITSASPSFASASVFDNCTLTIPVGTASKYRLADFWRNFVINTEEDEELGDYSDSQISSESFSFAQNGSVIETQSATILPLSIRNKYPVSAIEFDMEIPANITLSSPSLTTTDRTEGASVNTSQGADGMVHVTIQPNGTIAAGKGAILNLNINAGKAGDYEIKLKNVKLTTGQEITLDDSELQFVANHKQGDYNEDGNVNITDAQNLLDFVMGI